MSLIFVNICFSLSNIDFHPPKDNPFKLPAVEANTPGHPLKYFPVGDQV